MGKIYMLITIITDKNTQENYINSHIRIAKNHLSSTKSIQLDPWISEPRLMEKLLHLEVNLGYISWKEKN